MPPTVPMALAARIAEISEAVGLTIVDRVELPGRVGRFRPTPSALADSLRSALTAQYVSGLYAHQEVLLGQAGETLTLRHDMSGPEAFGPGILRALRYAATARGVARGIEAAFG